MLALLPPMLLALPPMLMTSRMRATGPACVSTRALEWSSERILAMEGSNRSAVVKARFDATRPEQVTESSQIASGQNAF